MPPFFFSILGIMLVLVALMAGKAEVKYNSQILDPPRIAQLIKDLGFGATVMEDNGIMDGKLDLIVSHISLYDACCDVPARWGHFACSPVIWHQC